MNGRSIICINDDDMKHDHMVWPVRACCDSAHTWVCVCVCTLGGRPTLWKRRPTLGTFSRAYFFPRDLALSMAL